MKDFPKSSLFDEHWLKYQFLLMESTVLFVKHHLKFIVVVYCPSLWIPNDEPKRFTRYCYCFFTYWLSPQVVYIFLFDENFPWTNLCDCL